MLSAFLANVRSLFNKLDDFDTVMRINNVDIACISETWLSDEVPSEAVSMNGFVLLRNDRSRRGGGVACFVKSALPCTRLHYLQSQSLESLWLLIRTIQHGCHVGCLI